MPPPVDEVPLTAEWNESLLWLDPVDSVRVRSGRCVEETRGLMGGMALPI